MRLDIVPCSACGATDSDRKGWPALDARYVAVLVDVARTYSTCLRCAWRALTVALVITSIVRVEPLIFALTDVVLAMARAALAPPPQ